MAASNDESADDATLLSERDLARRWRVSRRSLQRWRRQGVGPDWIRVGGSVRYRIASVLAHETAPRTIRRVPS